MLQEVELTIRVTLGEVYSFSIAVLLSVQCKLKWSSRSFDFTRNPVAMETNNTKLESHAGKDTGMYIRMYVWWKFLYIEDRSKGSLKCFHNYTS